MRMAVGFAGLLVASAAGAQTTTTNCTAGDYSVQCTSRTQPSYEQIEQQNQENMNHTIENIGAAIAAEREKRRAKRAAEAAAATQS